MKVLIINKYWYRRGGADRYAIWLADSLVKEGHTVKVFTVDHPENIADHDPVAISGVQTERMRLRDAPRTIGRMFWSFEAQNALLQLLRRESFDVAHIHNIYTQMSPSILSVLKAAGIPMVAHVHDYGMISANYSLFDRYGIDRSGTFWRVVLRRGVKGSFIASFLAAAAFKLHRHMHVYEKNIDRMIFTSHFVQRLFQSKGWVGDKGVIVPYVVDLKGEENKSSENHGYFFFVGRLHKTKGVHILLEAARKTGLKVVIAGDGPDRQELQRQAGAMTNIEFLGSTPNDRVLEYMRKATAVVVPSVWWEPFGMVAIEPQGLGTPVIASNTGGLAELVIHGKTGLLVTPGDVNELAHAMQRLADNKKEVAHMGQLAKRRFETQFKIEDHIKNVLHVYEDVIQRSHP